MRHDSNWRQGRDLLQSNVLAYSQTMPMLPEQRVDGETACTTTPLILPVAVRVENSRYRLQGKIWCDFALRHEGERRIGEDLLNKIEDCEDIHLA